MSTISAHASSNSTTRPPGRVLTHFTVDRRSPGNCRVTFEHPPINTVTAHVPLAATGGDLARRDQDTRSDRQRPRAWLSKSLPNPHAGPERATQL